MKKSKLSVTLSFAVILATGICSTRMLSADQPGFKRVELQRHDLAAAGQETVMARGELSLGAAAPKHTHPGEEVAYVLEGTVSLTVEGKPPTTLKAGDVFFIPAGVVHSAKNVGTGPAKILSTYILEKGKPLATPVK